MRLIDADALMGKQYEKALLNAYEVRGVDCTDVYWTMGEKPE